MELMEYRNDHDICVAESEEYFKHFFVVSNSGWTLEFVPTGLIDKEMCLTIVRRVGYTLKDVLTICTIEKCVSPL